MKRFHFIFVLAGCSLAWISLCAHGQSTPIFFQNLNFEMANIPSGTPISTEVPVTNAFPYWALSTGGSEYDAFSLGSSAISIIDSQLGFVVPLQGNYSALLFGGAGGPVTLSQTGLVPSFAKSMDVDLARSGIPLLVVAMNGQTISLIPIATFPGYTEYAGDISAFADQEVLLSFTQMPPPGTPPSQVEIDDIQFSTSPIPEPSTLALAAAGALLLGLARWRK